MKLWHIRLTIVIGTFGIMMYALSAIFKEVPGRSIVAGLVAAGLMLVGDVLVHALWHRVDRRRHRDHNSREPLAPVMSRRRFMAHAVTPTTAFAVGGVGFMGSTAPFEIRRVEIRLQHLPRALYGFRIGLLTDPHIGSWTSPDRLARAVDALNDAGVHVACMGGDLINDLALIDPTLTALERCRAPYGLFAVLGNHEKMGHKLPAILAAYERRPSPQRVRLLVDTHAIIDHDGTKLSIVGVDYPMHPDGPHTLPLDEHQAFMRASAAKAFHGITPGDPVICLSHHPDFFPIAADHGAWLTLAGHTHGGQFAMFGHPLIRSFAYMWGHYRRGAAQAYVSCGVGDWLPCRIGVPTEIAVLTLVPSV